MCRAGAVLAGSRSWTSMRIKGMAPRRTSTRADVFYASGHVDPGAGRFPYVAGFADERGRAATLDGLAKDD